MNEWICTACHWLGHVNEIRKEILFTATREEPEECEWYCPDCNKTDTLERKLTPPYCTVCENELVKNDGDLCSECQMANMERLADIARGH